MKHIFECSHCHKEICVMCAIPKKGICVDCMIIFRHEVYNKKYEKDYIGSIIENAVI